MAIEFNLRTGIIQRRTDELSSLILCAKCLSLCIIQFTACGGVCQPQAFNFTYTYVQLRAEVCA